MEQRNIKDDELRLMSIPEVCERLGIGNWMVYQQIRKNTLKTVKIGRRRLVSARALNDFIDLMER